MRVLVCGGREYRNEREVWSHLDEVQPSFVMEGGAGGADALAWKWATRNLPPDCRKTFEANWSADGKAAGPMRNQRMLDEGKPDLVIAFPGGKGTADMVRRAKRAGVQVRQVTD
jgi:hypothetical protein